MWRILASALLVLWARTGYTNPEITVDLPGGAQMEFVWIEPGTFLMGAPDSDSRAVSAAKPQHQVTISQGFWLGKREITQAQWESIMGTRPWSGQFDVHDNPNHPAVYISWDNLQEFIQFLNQAAGDSLYRLPTEAEWEYACRAGTTTPWSFGDDESQLKDYAWYESNNSPDGAKAVGMKLPNPWGLYDMHGNVNEWCQTFWEDYTSGAQVDPIAPATYYSRVTRGGFWGSSASGVGSTVRAGESPTDRYGNLGGRLVKMGPKIPTTITPNGWGQVKKEAR